MGLVKLPMKLPCDWGTKHPAIVAIWCYWKVSRVSTICADSQWCLASNSQYNASCGFLLWSCHQGSWWDEVSILETSNTNNQNHSQISLEATKKMDQKKGLRPVWLLKHHTVWRSSATSPFSRLSKTCQAFFKRRGKCDWCLWPSLTIDNLASWKMVKA